MKAGRHFDTRAQITWCAVSGVQPIVYVAKQDGRPVAILEWKPSVGFRLTTCTGLHLGDFPSLQAGEAELEHWCATRSAAKEIA